MTRLAFPPSRFLYFPRPRPYPSRFLSQQSPLFHHSPPRCILSRLFPHLQNCLSCLLISFGWHQSIPLLPPFLLHPPQLLLLHLQLEGPQSQGFGTQSSYCPWCYFLLMSWVEITWIDFLFKVFVILPLPCSFLECRDGNKSFPNSLHLPSVQEFSQVFNLDPEVRKFKLHTNRFFIFKFPASLSPPGPLFQPIVLKSSACYNLTWYDIWRTMLYARRSSTMQRLVHQEYC